MSRVRGKDTAPEIALRKALWAHGIRGWRNHPKDVAGRPDIVFRRWRVAVFVDGAFWHGHSSKFSPGRLSPEWEKKILGNIARDRSVDQVLETEGWTVVRIWDFEVERNPGLQATVVAKALTCRGMPLATR